MVPFCWPSPPDSYWSVHSPAFQPAVVNLPGGKRATRAYHHFTPKERAAALVAFLCSGRDHAATEAALKTSWAECFGEAMPPHTVCYCSAWEELLLETGGLLDRPKPGPPHQVPLEVAAEAAQLLMDGLPAKVLNPGCAPRDSRVHFPSFALALQFVPRLQAIMDTYGVSADTLLSRMKEARPDLAYALQRVKVLLSPEHKRQRQIIAQVLSTNTPGFWQNVVFVDETKIIVMGESPVDVKVWRAKGADGADHVIHVGGWGQQPIRIHLYAAVNAQLGLVAHWYSTGTTSLGQEWPWVRFAGIQGLDWSDLGYMVRGVAGRNQMLPSARMQRVALVRVRVMLLRKNQGSRTRPAATAGPGLYEGVNISKGPEWPALLKARALRITAAAAPSARPAAKSAWCRRTSAAPASHSVWIEARSLRCWWAGGTLCIVAEKWWCPSTCTYISVPTCQKSMRGWGKGGHTSHRHSVPGRRAASSANASRSWVDGAARAPHSTPGGSGQ